MSARMIGRVLAVSVAGVLFVVGQCQAQSRGTSTQSMFGSSQVGNPAGASGSGMGTGMTAGQGSNIGNAPVPGANSGAGGMGNSLELGANMQNFNPGGTTGFVGASANSARNLMSRVGTQGAVQGGRVNFGSLTNLMNQSRQNQFNRQQAQKASRSNTQAKSQFRVPLRLGFQPPVVSAGRVGPELSKRLSKLSGSPQLGPVNVSLVGQTAVLRGTVATEAERQLAEGVARLEPGVMAVRNELVVASEAPDLETLPAAVP